MGETARSESPRELILASTSPRRRELLTAAGFEFRVVSPRVDEQTGPDEAPGDLARRLALAKARSAVEPGGTPACILAADTLVVLDGDILGKPRDVDEARRMLLRLSGRTHRVVTGFAVVRSGDLATEAGVEESRVRLRSIAPEEAQRYAEGGEPLDKAGGYALQGDGARFVESVEGSRTNVIGLPLERVVPLLERLGIHPR